MGTSVLIALIGLAVAYVFYLVQPGLPMLLAYKASRLYDLIYNKYYVDELYDFLFVRPTVVVSTWMWRYFDVGVIDGLVNGTAQAVDANSGLWRRIQTGNVQHYAVSMLLGAMAILGYYALR
jgi:NADH-quinone oxidoreductase subunit L